LKLNEEFAVRWRAAEKLVAPLLQALTQMQEARSILLNHGIHQILRTLITDEQGKAHTTSIDDS
jgi:hypothetical protein